MADVAEKRKVFMDENKAEIMSQCDDSACVKTTAALRCSKHETQAAVEKASTYDCVICNVQAASTDDNPIGLVGLLQASSRTSSCVCVSCRLSSVHYSVMLPLL